MPFCAANSTRRQNATSYFESIHTASRSAHGAQAIIALLLGGTDYAPGMTYFGLWADLNGAWLAAASLRLRG